MKNQPTLAEVEALLAKEQQAEFEILPNGEVRLLGDVPASQLGGHKPLTFKEDLGGEYGTHET
jgi:hypothetical protein